MRLNAPKKIVWLISLILVVLCVIGHFIHIPVVTQYQFWGLLIGWALLFLGTTLKGF